MTRRAVDVSGLGPGYRFSDDGRPSRATPWAIVLAGGDGRRLRPAIRGWLGEDRPKQFCTLYGGRSMVQHAIDRAARVVAPDRIVCVIRDGQQRWLADALAEPLPGPIVVQPGDAGTFGAVYAALAAVSARDPKGTVIVLPSDHHVEPERAFARDIIHACLFTQFGDRRVALLGARADRPEVDYGWIGPGEGDESQLARFLGRRAARVRHFVEKPSRAEARRLVSRGYLWNTGVVAGQAEALWAIGLQSVGARMRPFEALRSVLQNVHRGRVPARHQGVALRHAFDSAPRLDFSRDVCQHPAAAAAAIVLPLLDVRWSDWGRAERVAAVQADHPVARFAGASGG